MTHDRETSERIREHIVRIPTGLTSTTQGRVLECDGEWLGVCFVGGRFVSVSDKSLERAIASLTDEANGIRVTWWRRLVWRAFGVD